MRALLTIQIPRKKSQQMEAYFKGNLDLVLEAKRLVSGVLKVYVQLVQHHRKAILYKAEVCNIL